MSDRWKIHTVADFTVGQKVWVHARLAEIDEAMAPLVALAGKVIGFANREALAKYVVSKIYQA